MVSLPLCECTQPINSSLSCWGQNFLGHPLQAEQMRSTSSLSQVVSLEARTSCPSGTGQMHIHSTSSEALSLSINASTVAAQPFALLWC